MASKRAEALIATSPLETVPVPEHPRPYAVVIGLDDGTTGLQTARILAWRGVPVVAIAGNRKHYCCHTNVCQKIVVSSTATDELIETLERLGPCFAQKPVLFPCQDRNVLLISRNRDRLSPWYHMVLPPADVVEMLMDKTQFAVYARRQGLPIPFTTIVRTEAEALQAAESMEFPCIVKPDNRSPAWNDGTAAKAFKVTNGNELMEVYRAHCQWANAFVVQQWIPGDDTHHITCNGYFDRQATPVITFTTQKLRQWPPTTGQGCLGVECRNEEVAGEMVKIFSGLGFRGLCYVEMKQNPITGQFLIIEPNIGRPTGRSATAEAAGVELIYSMYCDALGLPLPENLQQQFFGVKWIHWRRDVQAALHAWRNGQLNLRDMWRSWQGRKVDAIFSWRDPLPFVFDLLRGCRQLFWWSVDDQQSV